MSIALVRTVHSDAVESSPIVAYAGSRVRSAKAGARTRHYQNAIFASCVAGTFLAALLLRLIPVFFWTSIAQPDEIFQATEQGHRLVFGYGVVPWEFQYAVRSWLLGYFTGGIIWLTSLFGDNPLYYLRAIGTVCAILAAGSSVCAFLWGNRAYGILGGLVAAVVTATWIDGIFFGPRTLSEAIAAHLMVIGLYAAAPGYDVQSRGRLILAGVVLAFAALVRIQIAPSIALVWFWSDRNRFWPRFLLLSAGAALVFAFDGVFDVLTWHYPFEPLWNYFNVNFLMGLSAFFGRDPWWKYFIWMGAFWGGTVAVIVPLAIVGARRAPLLFAVAVAILVSHSFVAHKEYRFIYPAALLLSILAGLGLVSVIGVIVDGLRARGVRQSVVLNGVYVAVLIPWLLLAYVNFRGSDYEQWWSRNHDSASAGLYVSQLRSVCGVGLYGPRIFDTGGYSFIHQRVPLYESRTRYDVATIVREASAFNVMIWNMAKLAPRAPTPSELGYQQLKCFGDTCVGRREGGCASMPMVSPGSLPSGMPHPAPYSQGYGLAVPIADEPVPGQF